MDIWPLFLSNRSDLSVLYSQGGRGVLRSGVRGTVLLPQPRLWRVGDRVGTPYLPSGSRLAIRSEKRPLSPRIHLPQLATSRRS